MTPDEKETVIRYDEASDTASVYTCLRSIANSLIKRKIQPDRVDRNGGREVAWEFSVPKSWISIRPRRRVNHTPEQRAAMAARMAGLRKKPDVDSGNLKIKSSGHTEG